MKNAFLRRLAFSLLLFWLAACQSLPTLVGPSPLPPSPTPPPPTPSPTPIPAAATINGEILPLDFFQAELARYQQAQAALGLSPTQAEAASAVLEDLIAQTLLAQAAHEAGFRLDDAALQARRDALAAQMGGDQALRDWQSAQGYTEAAFLQALRLSVEAAWMRDKLIADVPVSAEQVHIRQILVYNEADAQEVSTQLAAGASFDELAAIYDPLTHGDIGWFPRGYLLTPEVEEAAFALQPDSISPVIHSASGYHLLRLLERDPNRSLAPDALRALQTRALSAWLAARRQSSQITLAK